MINKTNLNLSLKELHFKLYHAQLRITTKWSFHKEIKKGIKKNPIFKEVKKDKIYLKECREFLRTNFSGYKNTNWHVYYSGLRQNKKVEYIPDSLFFSEIFPALSRTQLSKAYLDKTAYNLYYEDSVMPETILKILNGRIYDSDHNFLKKEDAITMLERMEHYLVLKPAVDSNGGKGVLVDNASYFANLIHKNLISDKKSYILQKWVEQHPEMAKFNNSSVNTLRILTARVDSEIEPLAALMRIGRNNAKIDNISQGGLFIGINKDGSLHDFAIDMEFNSYFEHPNTKVKFEGFKIPNYQGAVDFCKKHHKKFMHFTFIAWDIAIGKNEEPVLIEHNFKRPGMDIHQYLDGPLFGKHTKYFLNRLKEEKVKNSFYY